MKAVRLFEIGQPLELQEIPVPEVGEQDVLVRIKAAGICHSDVHYRAGTSPAGPLPVTLGHEVAGVVEQVGAHVTQIEPGDRVCLHYLVIDRGACPRRYSVARRDILRTWVCPDVFLGHFLPRPAQEPYAAR